MKANDFWTLQWGIPKGGYYWDNEGYRSIVGDSKISDRPYLVQKKQDDSIFEASTDIYQSNLFQTFADLSKSKSLDKNILKFANRYGAIGEELVIINPSTGQPYKGEPLTLWKNEIWRMKWIVDMWHSLNQGTGFFGKHIIWMDIKTPVFAIGEHFSDKWDIQKALMQEGYDKSISPRFRWVEPLPQGVWNYGDLRGPANYIVSNTINERLNPMRGSRLKARVGPMIIIDQSNEYKPSFMPSNLLALLWVQLYEMVTGLRKFRYCGICHGLLDVTEHTKAKRVHDKCSNKERQRRYHEKYKK